MADLNTTNAADRAYMRDQLGVTSKTSAYARMAGRPQLIATRGHMPFNFQGNGKNGRSDTRSETRIYARMGRARANMLQVVYANWYDLVNAGGETAIANTATLEAALELTSPASFLPLSFAGLETATLPAKARLFISDPLGVNGGLAADADIILRSSLSVASTTHPMPAMTNLNDSRDTGFVSAAASGQAFATGAMTLPSGGAASGGFGPMAVIGVPETPIPAVVHLTDSLGYGANDTNDTHGNTGYIERGLYDVDGHAVPWAALSRGGDRLEYNRGATSWRKQSLLRYGSHFLCNLGTNDIPAAPSLAQMQAWYQAIWTGAKAAGLHVTQVLLTPRTTSTDSWATAANQTIASGYGPGGLRDQVNLWIPTQVGGGLLDAVIDLSSYFEDAANPGKWKTNGSPNYLTDDGLHYTTAGHVAAKAAITAWAATLSLA